MQDGILSDFKKFREQLFHCFSYRANATMELIDSLYSNITADSVVKLSLNTHFTRAYNSIRDAIANFDISDFKNEFNNLLATKLPGKNVNKFHLFGLDATSISRPYAECLSDYNICQVIANKHRGLYK